MEPVAAHRANGRENWDRTQLYSTLHWFHGGHCSPLAGVLRRKREEDGVPCEFDLRCFIVRSPTRF